jgi:hypothetical protein
MLKVRIYNSVVLLSESVFNMAAIFVLNFEHAFFLGWWLLEVMYNDTRPYIFSSLLQ